MLAHGPGKDRFYMDLSVYKIDAHRFDDDGDPDSLIWRGLYLALTTASAEEKPEPLNPFLNFWN